MATSKQKTFRLAWANRHGLDYLQVDKLIRLVNKAANAQTQEHNRPNAPDSSPAIKAVEDYLSTLGFSNIKWPGLYPCFDSTKEKGLHAPE
jgi:hypothetical protein